MKFGVLVNTSISDWQLVPFAEQLGFDSAWFGDSQMIWSDCYATMALAAHHTSRIHIGTGVTIAGTRIPPVVASAIGTINQLAPGRTHIGIGTGHTAMRTMGFQPFNARQFREYVRVLRALLDGEAVEFSWNGETHEITHLHMNEGFFDFSHKIPLYVGASGPLACKTAGAYGDGRVSFIESPAEFAKARAGVAEGAAAVSRTLPEPFPHAFLTTALVMRPGETLASERVINAIGAEATARLHGWWEAFEKTGGDDFIPADCRDVWAQYLVYLKGLGLGRDALHRHIHKGHCTYMVPAERRFVTPELVRQTGLLIAPPDELIHHVRQLEAAGATELIFLCPSDTSRAVYADIAREIIERY